MRTQPLGAPRTRRAFLAGGATLASCATLAIVGSAAASAATAPTKAGKPKVTELAWGTAPATSEQPTTPVELYTLRGAGGMKVNVSTYGADVQSIDVPDKNGKPTDVALGFPNLASYVGDFEQGYTGTAFPAKGGAGDTYFGATIGRYANRIAGTGLQLNGQTYKLDLNNNSATTLHGGYLGWNTYVWSGTPSTSKTDATLTLSATFPAGEGCDLSLTPGCNGFPATVTAQVTYSVTPQNELQIAYGVTNTSTNLATVVNVTNHSYFNLSGQATGNVYGQDLAINADAYQPTNPVLIPELGTNGSYFQDVQGTPYDFRKMHTIGKYLSNGRLPDGTSGPIRQLQYAHGYDNNWVLNGYGRYREIAVAQSPKSGITMWTYTDQPGVQFYSSNFLVGDLAGTTGTLYKQGAGFTLETQHYPDSPSHIGQAGWPSVVLPAGQTFTSRTAFRFGVKPASYAKTVSFK